MPAVLTGDERIHTLDILRGFALFGMILVHFHQKMRLEVSGPEDLIGWFVYIFVEQKAWGTFALLFGAGFAILLRRLDARGRPSAAIFLRRLAALAVIGLVPEIFFGFSILFTYAVWGLALFVVRRWSTRALLALALFAVIAQPAAYVAAKAWAVHSGVPLKPPPYVQLHYAAQAAAEHGSYAELLAARWALFAGTTPGTWRSMLPDINLALFLIGLLAVRHRVIDEPLRHVRVIVGAMAFGAVSWLLAWIGVNELWGLVEDQWLCLTYAGGVLLGLAKWPAWTTRLTAFGLAGRMALTNYMVQAILLDVLSSAYGVGMKLRPLLYVPSAVALFGLEAGFSYAWLRRHRYGPLEWVWRAVTYWQRP